LKAKLTENIYYRRATVTLDLPRTRRAITRRHSHEHRRSQRVTLRWTALNENSSRRLARELCSRPHVPVIALLYDPGILFRSSRAAPHRYNIIQRQRSSSVRLFHVANMHSDDDDDDDRN